MVDPVNGMGRPKPILSERSTRCPIFGHNVADYVVEVDGELERPALEWSKHSAYAWFAPEGLGRLKENRAPGEYLIHDVIVKALRP